MNNLRGLLLRQYESVELLRTAFGFSSLNTGERRFPPRSFFVDSENGSDQNDGTSPDRAFATIQAGLDAARYPDGASEIDYDWKSIDRFVFVAPGHYNEQVLFSSYNVHLVGLGPAVPGKDYGVSINYDGAVDDSGAPCVVGFSGSGNSISNVTVNVGAYAIAGIYVAFPGDNNLIENCVILGDGATATYGILAGSLKGSWIRDCVIEGFVTAAIEVVGGANHYAIQGGIVGCQIKDPAGKGIHIGDTVTAYNFRIDRNFIDAEAAGAVVAIHNEATGNVFITDNYIIVESTGTAITSASHGSLQNHVSKNGTVTDPTDDD